MKKILLVEDDLLAARAYQKLLEKSGFEVDNAFDGEECLMKANNGYDFVLLDIVMPKIDGWEVLKKIKERDDVGDLPIAVFTVLDGNEHRKRAKELGAVAFINKLHDDVVEEIRRILKP